jgi:c(7)-type cytochrome triheme protein
VTKSRAQTSDQRRRIALLLFLSMILSATAGSMVVFRSSSVASAQGPDVDYSKFLHTSQKHASLECNSCHQRTDNSATPRFPGHSACTSCHLGQFTTPAIPMCVICHTDVNSSKPPLRNFPAAFKERFNIRFDHAQHMATGVRPQNGCNACHNTPTNRAAGLSIPVNLAAHNTCYTCHTPSSKSTRGQEIASCGVCHGQNSYKPTSTSSRLFRLAFSHAKHGPRERLACNDCHNVTAGLAQSRQVSSPAGTEHFPTSRSMNCSTCHNGKRAFGGDLGFKDCKRCHSGQTFTMPM